MRFFNTEGPIRRDRHYHIPPLDRVNLDDLLGLVRDERYFVLHAPRQTGKTSALLALRDLLNAGSDYRYVYVTVEAGQAARENVADAMRVILYELESEEQATLGSNTLADVWPGALERAGPLGALRASLARWCMADPQPLVLLIDEIDTPTDPGMRCRVQVGLNKGEAHHALKRAINFHHRGELRDRTGEGQHYRVAGLNLLGAIIIYWNTLKLGEAVFARREAGLAIPAEFLAHVSPLGWEHINLTGEYRWPRTGSMGSAKPAIFDYVYGVLHAPAYRERWRACGSGTARRSWTSTRISPTTECGIYQPVAVR